MEDKWEGFSSESDDETLSIAQRLEIVGEKTGIATNNAVTVREDLVKDSSGNSGLGDIGRLLRDNVPLVSREEEMESDWIESAIKPKAKRQKKRRRERPPTNFASQFSSAFEYSMHFMEMVDAEFEVVKENADEILSTATFDCDLSMKSLFIKIKLIDDFVCGDVLTIKTNDEPLSQRIVDINEDEKILEVNMPEGISLRDIRGVELEDTYIHSKMVWTLEHFTESNPSANIVLGRPESVRESLTPAIDPEFLRGLNRSQEAAVRRAVARSFSLIQGPPGSGKTKTAAAIVGSVAKSRRQLLVCAPSNIAVDQLAIRVYQLECFRRPDAEVKMVRLYSHGKEKNSPAATQEFSFHYILRTCLAEKYPQFSLMLNSLEVPTRRDMQTILGDSPDSIKVRDEGGEVLSQFDIVCCTIASSVNAFVTRNKCFDFVLVDEAAFSPEAETLMALHSSCRKVVLIGDPWQLPPVVQSDYARNGGYGISMFERLMKHCGMGVTYLDVQYRMLPVISRFPRETFYGGKLVDDESVKRMRPSPQVARFFSRSAIVLVDCEGEESQRPETFSFYNTKEAVAVANVLKRLHLSGTPGSSIGVIAAYDAQRRLLLKTIRKLNLGDWAKAVEIRSVDGYQGREKDIIVISTVRANQVCNIGFLRDLRRVNVALTRAKFGLVLVGNFRVLQANDIWGRFLQYAKSVGEQRSVGSLE